MYIPDKVTYLVKEGHCSLPLKAGSKRINHYTRFDWTTVEMDNRPVAVSLDTKVRYRYIPYDYIPVTVTTDDGKVFYTGISKVAFVEAAMRGITTEGLFNDTFIWGAEGLHKLVSLKSDLYPIIKENTKNMLEFVREQHIPYRRLVAGYVYKTRMETFGSNAANEWYQGRYSTTDLYGNQKQDMHLVISGMYTGDFNKNSISDFKAAYLADPKSVKIYYTELRNRVDYSEVVDYIGVRPLKELREIGMRTFTEEHASWKASSSSYYYPKANTFMEHLKNKSSWSRTNMLLANISIDSKPYINPGFKELGVVIEPKGIKKRVRIKTKSAE